MGSRFSKVLRPRKAGAVPIGQHNMDNAKQEPRQDPAPTPALPTVLDEVRVKVAISSDDLDIFAPGSNMSDRSDLLQQLDEAVASFELWLAEFRLRSIDYEPGSPLPQETTTTPLSAPPPPPPLEPVEEPPQCLTCCKELPQEEDPKYVAEVVKPCRSCDSSYCGDCVRKMFIDACNDIACMPPRCCARINLHHARPFLTQEEAALFRAKYEEWSTPKPFYCPVPVCSAFIPERLLPQQVASNGKDKQRVDSGVGTPTANTFECPTCSADICSSCRQMGHPGINCHINEFGLDDDTAALLISWGYKKCPKCGHGVKRMYGCSHMQCRCGAHFCWGCLQLRDEDMGVCDHSDDEDDYDEDDYEPDSEEDSKQSEAAEDTATASDTEGDDQSSSTSESEPVHRIRNLDGGSASYWEAADLDFGEEPSNDIIAWDCRHAFSDYSISLASVLKSPRIAHDMECVRCWKTIYPSVNSSYTSSTSVAKRAPVRSIRDYRSGVGRVRRRRYAPPRGLFRADATIGTAPHLTAEFPRSSEFTHLKSLMLKHIRGTSAQRISPTLVPPTTPQNLLALPNRITTQSPVSPAPLSTIFPISPAHFSLAQECRWCAILLCGTCKDTIIAKRDAEEAEEEAEEERRREAEEERRREVEREHEEGMSIGWALDHLPDFPL